MINLTFIFQAFKGRCHGNQFLGENAKITIFHLYSSRWHSTIDRKITTLMDALSAVMIALHHVDIW